MMSVGLESTALSIKRITESQTSERDHSTSGHLYQYLLNSLS